MTAIYPAEASRRRWGWVSVTHVCRRLRVIALGHAILWSDLSINGDTPWDYFLPRSQGALLNIRGRDSGRGRTIYATRTLQNIGRLRCLDIRSITSFAADAGCWLQILHITAPELRELTLAMDPYHRHMESNPERPTMSSRFLDLDAPNLRDLSLSGIRMPWVLDTPILLRSLSVQLGVPSEDKQYSTADVLRCLQNMPSLQDLILVQALPPSTVDSVGIRVKMPYLRLLLLIEDDGRCLDLWSSLVLPATCIICVDAGKIDAQGVATLQALLNDQLAKPRCPTYRRLRLGDPENPEPVDYPRIAFSVHSTASVADADATARSIDRDGIGEYPLKVDMDSMLYLAFTVTSLSELYYNLLPPPHRERDSTIDERRSEQTTWLKRYVFDLLSRFPAVEVIELWGPEDDFEDPVDESLAQALYACLLDSTLAVANHDVDPARMLPNMHTLSLHNACLHHPCIYDDQRRRLHDVLREVFERRQALDTPIRTLKLLDSTVRDNWIATWSLFVEEILCPGCYDPESSGHDEDMSEESSSH